VPAARIQEKTRISRYLEGWVRVDIGLTAVTGAVLAVGFALTSPGTDAIGPGSAEPQTEPETRFVSAFAQAERAAEPADDREHCATFDERFFFDQQSDSFDERFASAFGSSGKAAGKPATVGVPDDNLLRQQLDRPAATQPTPTPMTISRHANVREERLNIAGAPMSVSLPLDSDSRTAVYDIAARTVYLPNGHRLEAHSGLGSRLDDPRYISTKGQGPTPPNVYNLTLRERLFHGVRAIRLVPVEDGKMFGRDGILAHSYMLGPNGQSNGCVSFRDYPAFLNAYLRGEVNRLVVVEHLATTTGTRAGSASGG
jgi:type VI secretion system (T6SS) effector TldE1-like protein